MNTTMTHKRKFIVDTQIYLDQSINDTKKIKLYNVQEHIEELSNILDDYKIKISNLIHQINEQAYIISLLKEQIEEKNDIITTINKLKNEKYNLYI
jgi:hypothetical protein